MLGSFVVVRTRSAGIHLGTLYAREGQEAQLTDARRLWYWTGARTLHEVSQAGIKAGSKISDPVPLIQLTEVIEVIPCSPAGRKSLSQSQWG
jgi:hypothetical protein